MPLLRQRTADLHARVEQSAGLIDFCRDLAAYRSLLLRQLPFYAEMESRLVRLDWATVPLNFSERRKATLIEDDLGILGVDEMEISAARRLPAELAKALPRPASIAEGFGCLYVLEGATLGGKIIARMLAGSLGVTRETGASFYDPYGGEAGRFWREFGDAANRYCSDDPARIDDTVAGAIATFEAFETWLAGLTRSESQIAASTEGDASI